MDSALNLVTRTHAGLSFNSLHFLALCLLAVPLVRLTANTGIRRWALLLLNVYFFAQLVAGLAPAVFLGSLLLFTHGFAELRVRYGNFLPAAVFPFGVLLFWALLFVVKDPVFTSLVNPFRRHPILFIGFSYVIFRCIHYVMDAEAFERRSLLTLTNFVIFFPTLLAGPLERYETFQKFEGGATASLPMLPSLHRIATGLIKKYVIADNLMSFGFFAMPDEVNWSAPALWIGVLSQLALLYLDFSGYCDIAIGLCRLMGFTLVENFDRPWLARDLPEFWNRWHMSLSNFLKDYFFSPLSHLVFYHVRPRFQFVLITLIYAFTMVVVSVWHGLTWGFLTFGLMHGVALAGTQLSRQLPRLCREDSLLARFRSSALYGLLRGAALYCFISVTLVFGYCGIQGALRIFSVMVGL